MLARAFGLALAVSAAGCTGDRREGGTPALGGNTVPGGSSGGGGETGGAGGGSGGPSCDYPSGPFGLLPGEVLDEDLSWEGFAEGASQAGVIDVEGYLDCEGALGSKAVIVLQVAEWCAVCQGEALAVNELLLSEYEQLGVRVLYLVVEDSDGDPADVATAGRWHEAFGLPSNAVAADPDFTFAVDDVTFFPQKILIDPRTMTIAHHALGAVPIDEELDALLTAND